MPAIRFRYDHRGAGSVPRSRRAGQRHRGGAAAGHQPAPPLAAAAEPPGSARRAGGRVAGGSLPTVGAYILPAPIEVFLRQHPQVQLRVAEAHAEELEERVAAGLLDLAITTLPLQRVELVTQKLWTESFMLAAPRGHRLAKSKRAVPLAAVVAEPLVIVGASTANAALWAACEATGRKPHIAIEVDHPQSQRRMVERGGGVALMPAIMARDHAGGRFDVVEVAGSPRRTVALVHRGEPSLTYGARALKRFLVERLRQPG